MISSRVTRLLAISGLSAALGACSFSTEDVHTSFCKTLTSQMTGVPDYVIWKNADTKMVRLEDMEVKLDFDVVFPGGESQAMTSTCFYEYDVRAEQESMIGVDIRQNFSTAPNKMIFNGQVIPESVLVAATNKGHFVQAEQNLKMIKAAAEKAAAKARSVAEEQGLLK